MVNESPRQRQLRRIREQQAGVRPGMFSDDWENDFDANFRKVAKRGAWAFAGIFLANLIVLGVLIWGYVQLVQWVTAQ